MLEDVTFKRDTKELVFGDTKESMVKDISLLRIKVAQLENQLGNLKPTESAAVEEKSGVEQRSKESDEKKNREQ